MLHKTPGGENAGLISNIQKYTIHDGPGIRTEIFFAGCPLRCIWCSNPETLSSQKQFGIYPSKCLSLDKCGYCLKSCPVLLQNSSKTPISHDKNGLISDINIFDECVECFKCADACPSGAIKVWGQHYTSDELMKIIEEDRKYYIETGGGVTLSGGEVMMQWEFASELLKKCKEASINTCVETALHCKWEQAESVFKYVDLIITDIKHMDSEKHSEITGVGNELILDNIIKASKMGIDIVIRTPIVHGYNAEEDHIRSIGRFIKEEIGSSLVQYQLLPYRKMGTEKYDSLRLAYPMGDYISPERSVWEEKLILLRDLLITEYGLPVAAGSGEKLNI